jgi:deoxycytidylate deaminase
MKCPHCKKPVVDFRIQDVVLHSGKTKLLRGVAISCQKCDAVLNVQVNPFPLHDALLDQVRKYGAS